MDLKAILDMNSEDETKLRKRNIDLIAEVSVLKEHKAILYEMVKILIEVIKQFGEKCNRYVEVENHLMKAMNEIVTTALCPETLTNPNIEIKMDISPPKREVIITEHLLKNGIYDIEKLKNLIDENDIFVFK